MSECGVCNDRLKELMKSCPLGVSVPRYLVDFARERNIKFSRLMRDALEKVYFEENGFILEKPTVRRKHKNTMVNPEQVVAVATAAKLSKLMVNGHRRTLVGFRKTICDRFFRKYSKRAAMRRANCAICNAIAEGAIVLYEATNRAGKSIHYIDLPSEKHPTTEIENYEDIVNTFKTKV